MNESLAKSLNPGESQGRNRSGAQAIQAPILQRAPRSAAAEAFRSLRTALEFIDPAKTRTLLITSAGPGDGKSTCAANLAVALAQVGKRVLLVDADMRRPSLHERFHLGHGVGLSHVLVGRGDEGAIEESAIPGLSVLIGGVVPPNPAELLDGGVLDRCLARWSETYDHVLLDSPPVLAVTDPVVIARKVTGVVLVARAASTRDRALERACAVLRAARANLLGTVVNDLVAARQGDYGYGYAYYHGADDKT